MILNKLKPRKSLNKAFLKVKPNRSDIETFKANLIQLIDQTNDTESEEFHKNLVSDFLKKTYYDPNHSINTKGRNDLVIHNGKDAKSILLESKSATEATSITEAFNIYAFELSNASSLNNRTIEQIPTTDYIQFGSMELTISAKKAINEMAMMIGASGVKFDKIRAFVEYNSNSIKLGEEFEAKVYFTATASRRIKEAYYLVNNDTLEVIDNYGYYKFKPTVKGVSELNFRIGADETSILTQYNIQAQKVLLEVK